MKQLYRIATDNILFRDAAFNKNKPSGFSCSLLLLLIKVEQQKSVSQKIHS